MMHFKIVICQVPWEQLKNLGHHPRFFNISLNSANLQMLMYDPCIKVMREIQNKSLQYTGPCSAVGNADPGVASSILAWSLTFVEIDHEIISTVLLLPSAESFKKGCCQLQAKVCARSTG